MDSFVAQVRARVSLLDDASVIAYLQMFQKNDMSNYEAFLPQILPHAPRERLIAFYVAQQRRLEDDGANAAPIITPDQPEISAGNSLDLNDALLSLGESDLATLELVPGPSTARNPAFDAYREEIVQSIRAMEDDQVAEYLRMAEDQSLFTILAPWMPPNPPLPSLSDRDKLLRVYLAQWLQHNGAPQLAPAPRLTTGAAVLIGNAEEPGDRAAAAGSKRQRVADAPERPHIPTTRAPEPLISSSTRVGKPSPTAPPSMPLPADIASFAAAAAKEAAAHSLRRAQPAAAAAPPAPLRPLPAANPVSARRVPARETEAQRPVEDEASSSEDDEGKGKVPKRRGRGRMRGTAPEVTKGVHSAVRRQAVKSGGATLLMGPDGRLVLSYCRCGVPCTVRHDRGTTLLVCSAAAECAYTFRLCDQAQFSGYSFPPNPMNEED